MRRHLRITPHPAHAALAAVLAMAWFASCWAQAAAPPSGPAAWIDAFRHAYETRDLAAYGALLTDDFRFHFGDAEDRARYPNGWGKAEELVSAEHVFAGGVNARGIRVPRPATIDLDLGEVRVGPDPDHPGDVAHYALVTADHVRLALGFGWRGETVATGRHAFWLVREAGCWRVRRWVEEPTDRPVV